MPTNRSWTVREATSTDIGKINDLFVATMGMERSLTHDQWKFWDNPFGAPYIVVAEVGDKLVGQYALWPTPLRLGLEEVRGAQSLDTMTHPGYQGQGMFIVLANACFEVAMGRGCEALYGFPNENSYRGFVRRLNWDHSGNVRAFTRLIAPGKHPRFAGAKGAIADVLANALPSGSRAGVEFRYERPTDEAIEAILASSRKEKEACRVDRTSAWYRWRFAEPSGRSYEWISAYRSQTLVGWAIWGRDILVPYPRALLSDLIASDATAEVALVSAVITRTRANHMTIVSAMTNSPSTGRALRRCGFYNHTAVPMIVRGLTSRTMGGNIHDHPSWQVFGADLDTF